MTILKHVDGKTVAVKLGNYQSHGNHKRSLLARNLSNPLPPASLFHGNLARKREGEGYRRRERKGSTKKGWKKTGKGASFAMKNNWRSFCATRTKAGSEGGGGGAAICAHEILFLFRYGIENEGMCSILFLFFPFFPFLFFHYWSARIFSGFFSIRIRNWKELKFNLICQEFWSCITKDFRFRIDFFFESLCKKVSNRET